MWATYEMNGVAHRKFANPGRKDCVKGLNGAEEFEWFLQPREISHVSFEQDLD